MKIMKIMLFKCISDLMYLAFAHEAVINKKTVDALGTQHLIEQCEDHSRIDATRHKDEDVTITNRFENFFL